MGKGGAKSNKKSQKQKGKADIFSDNLVAVLSSVKKEGEEKITEIDMEKKRIEEETAKNEQSIWHPDSDVQMHEQDNIIPIAEDNEQALPILLEEKMGKKKPMPKEKMAGAEQEKAMQGLVPTGEKKELPQISQAGAHVSFDRQKELDILSKLNKPEEEPKFAHIIISPKPATSPTPPMPPYIEEKKESGIFSFFGKKSEQIHISEGEKKAGFFSFGAMEKEKQIPKVPHTPLVPELFSIPDEKVGEQKLPEPSIQPKIFKAVKKPEIGAKPEVLSFKKKDEYVGQDKEPDMYSLFAKEKEEKKGIFSFMQKKETPKEKPLEINLPPLPKQSEAKFQPVKPSETKFAAQPKQSASEIKLSPAKPAEIKQQLEKLETNLQQQKPGEIKFAGQKQKPAEIKSPYLQQKPSDLKLPSPIKTGETKEMPKQEKSSIHLPKPILLQMHHFGGAPFAGLFAKKPYSEILTLRQIIFITAEQEKERQKLSPLFKGAIPSKPAKAIVATPSPIKFSLPSIFQKHEAVPSSEPFSLSPYFGDGQKALQKPKPAFLSAFGKQNVQQKKPTPSQQIFPPSQKPVQSKLQAGKQPSLPYRASQIPKPRLFSFPVISKRLQFGFLSPHPHSRALDLRKPISQKEQKAAEKKSEISSDQYSLENVFSPGGWKPPKPVAKPKANVSLFPAAGGEKKPSLAKMYLIRHLSQDIFAPKPNAASWTPAKIIIRRAPLIKPLSFPLHITKKYFDRGMFAPKPVFSYFQPKQIIIQTKPIQLVPIATSMKKPVQTAIQMKQTAQTKPTMAAVQTTPAQTAMQTKPTAQAKPMLPTAQAKPSMPAAQTKPAQPFSLFPQKQKPTAVAIQSIQPQAKKFEPAKLRLPMMQPMPILQTRHIPEPIFGERKMQKSKEFLMPIQIVHAPPKPSQAISQKPISIPQISQPMKKPLSFQMQKPSRAMEAPSLFAKTPSLSPQTLQEIKILPRQKHVPRILYKPIYFQMRQPSRAVEMPRLFTKMPSLAPNLQERKIIRKPRPVRKIFPKPISFQMRNPSHAAQPPQFFARVPREISLQLTESEVKMPARKLPPHKPPESIQHEIFRMLQPAQEKKPEKKRAIFQPGAGMQKPPEEKIKLADEKSLQAKKPEKKLPPSKPQESVQQGIFKMFQPAPEKKPEIKAGKKPEVKESKLLIFGQPQPKPISTAKIQPVSKPVQPKIIPKPEQKEEKIQAPEIVYKPVSFQMRHPERGLEFPEFFARKPQPIANILNPIVLPPSITELARMSRSGQEVEEEPTMASIKAPIAHEKGGVAHKKLFEESLRLSEPAQEVKLEEKGIMEPKLIISDELPNELKHIHSIISKATEEQKQKFAVQKEKISSAARAQGIKATELLSKIRDDSMQKLALSGTDFAQYGQRYRQELSRPVPTSSQVSAYYRSATAEQKKYLRALEVESLYWKYETEPKESRKYKKVEYDFMYSLENSSPDQRIVIEQCINLTKALGAIGIFTNPKSTPRLAAEARYIYANITRRHPNIMPLLYYQVAKLAFFKAYSGNMLSPPREYLQFVSKLDDDMREWADAMRASFFDKLINDPTANPSLREIASSQYSQLLVSAPGISKKLETLLKVRRGTDIFFALYNASEQEQRQLREAWQKISGESESVCSILFYELASIFANRQGAKTADADKQEGSAKESEEALQADEAGSL